MGWKGLSSARRLLVPALLASGLAGAVARPASGQVSVQASNSFITVTLGVSGTATGVTPAVNLAGRIGMTDNTTNNTGALLTFISSAVKQSYVTVRIDGGPPTPGADADTQTSPGWDLIFGDVGSNALDATATGQKTNEGAWVQAPIVSGNTITAKWATLPSANLTFPIPPIEIDLKVTLIHDDAAFQFTVINKDNRTHTIGLRFGQDVARPGAGVEGPIYTPNLGGITSDVDLMGSLVPPYWRGFSTNGATNGAVLAGTMADTLVTRPDRVTFGSPTNVTGSLWNFTADPTDSFVSGAGDVASGVYFNPRSYAAGESRTITTIYGRNHSTIDFDTPFPAGVDAPFSVKYDPSQPAGQQLTPNPMAVTGFVFNPRTFGLTNVVATISLPSGLALATGETTSKTIGDVSSNNEGSTTWQVVPTGGAVGNQTISVSFTAGPGTQGKVVTRTIELPSLPAHNFPGGIQMVSFPYTFADPTPSVALGLPVINFDLLRWNPVQSIYEPVSRILPGEGYWLRLQSGQTINLQGAQPVTVTSSAFEIKLLEGWQQIGNPFLYSVNWADVQVINTDITDPNALVPVSVAQAAANGWILSTIYRYDPVAGEYVYNSDISMDLVPFEGYWVRSFRPNISLLIPPTNGRAVKITGSGRSITRAPGGWSLRLALKGEHTQDTYNFIGLAPSATDGADKFDVEKPPAVQGAVRLGILRPTWGRKAGVYATDIQAPTGRKQWDIVVSSAAPNENVTLSWPEITRLPRTYELTITDKSTGVRTLMRQTIAMRVNTGQSGSRSYTITAEPRSPGNALLLTVGADSRAAGISKLTVRSNLDATFTVRVVGTNGQSVRQISGGRAVSAAQDTTVIWDGKDNRGVSVPSGVYNFEVKGVTPDGQTAKRIVPVTIVR